MFNLKRVLLLVFATKSFPLSGWSTSLMDHGKVERTHVVCQRLTIFANFNQTFFFSAVPTFDNQVSDLEP